MWRRGENFGLESFAILGGYEVLAIAP